jgi:hypothetical protein
MQHGHAHSPQRFSAGTHSETRISITNLQSNMIPRVIGKATGAEYLVQIGQLVAE